MRSQDHQQTGMKPYRVEGEARLRNDDDPNLSQQLESALRAPLTSQITLCSFLNPPYLRSLFSAKFDLENRLYSILTYNSVRWELERTKSRSTDEELDDICGLICNPFLGNGTYRKVFAVLVIIGVPHAIHLFILPDYSDEALPLSLERTEAIDSLRVSNSKTVMSNKDPPGLSYLLEKQNSSKTSEDHNVASQHDDLDPNAAQYIDTAGEGGPLVQEVDLRDTLLSRYPKSGSPVTDLYTKMLFLLYPPAPEMQSVKLRIYSALSVFLKLTCLAIVPILFLGGVSYVAFELFGMRGGAPLICLCAICAIVWMGVVSLFIYRVISRRFKNDDQQVTQIAQIEETKNEDVSSSIRFSGQKMVS